MKFDPKQYQERIAWSASIMDVTDVSLEKFKAKGGKILMTHGTADDFITPHNSEVYYERQVKQFGQARRGQLHALLHDSRLRPRLRAVQREDRQPDGAAGLGGEGRGADGPDGRRTATANANRVAAAVRVAEVAEVHRRRRHREQRRQLHLRRMTKPTPTNQFCVAPWTPRPTSMIELAVDPTGYRDAAVHRTAAAAHRQTRHPRSP